MARRKRSAPATSQGRDIARAIAEGKRQGLTNRQIGATLGINERTVRKIRAGETSGTKTYARLTRKPQTFRAEKGLFNAEYVIGYDGSGQPIIGSTNVSIGQIRTLSGDYRDPTALDVFRVRRLAATIARERAQQARSYAQVATLAPVESPIRLRAISRARRHTALIRTGPQ